MIRARSARPATAARVAVVVAAILVALLVAGLLGWEGVRRYRPALAEGETYGVDVSHHQGRIAWDSVADDGIERAYIKATEGETWVDPRFEDNWEGAAAAGVARGAYHFFSLCSRGHGQLANFLDVAPVDPAALPPAVDLEFGACEERPESATVERDLRIFLDGVERAWGRPAVLYVLPEFAATYPFLSDLDGDRWQRRILKRPIGDYVIWQASHVARVDGIAGSVDLNVWRPVRATALGR